MDKVQGTMEGLQIQWRFSMSLIPTIWHIWWMITPFISHILNEPHVDITKYKNWWNLATPKIAQQWCTEFYSLERFTELVVNLLLLKKNYSWHRNESWYVEAQQNSRTTKGKNRSGIQGLQVSLQQLLIGALFVYGL